MKFLHFSLNFYISYIAFIIKSTESFRLSFISPTPFLGPRYYFGRRNPLKSSPANNNPGSPNLDSGARDLKLFSTTLQDQESPSHLSDDFLQCPSFDDFLEKKLLFSSGIMDFSKEEEISRELDHRLFSEESSKNVKRFFAIVLSTVAVGILYKLASFLKDLVEQQYLSLSSPESFYV